MLHQSSLDLFESLKNHVCIVYVIIFIVNYNCAKQIYALNSQDKISRKLLEKKFCASAHSATPHFEQTLYLVNLRFACCDMAPPTYDRHQQ